MKRLGTRRIPLPTARPQSLLDKVERIVALIKFIIIAAVLVFAAGYGLTIWAYSTIWGPVILRTFVGIMLFVVAIVIMFAGFLFLKYIFNALKIWKKNKDVEMKMEAARVEFMLAKANKEKAEAETMLADAHGRHRQSQYITVAARSALAIDTETGKQQWYSMSPKAEASKEEKLIDNPFAEMDATEIYEQIYRRTLSDQNCPSFIIAGEKRSGKSTFMDYLTHRYANEAEYIVYDLKQPDPRVNWGPNVRLVGQRGNYAEMAAEMDRAEAEVKTMKPDPNRAKRFYVFDEWINLLAVKENRFGKRVFFFMIKVLTEWSYLGIGVIIMPHAIEKTALGFPPGYGGLVRNYDGIIWFDYNLFTDERKCYLEIKGQRYEIKLWNPDTAPRGSAQRTPHTENVQKGPSQPLLEVCAGVRGVRSDDIGPDDWRAEKPVITDFFESKQEKIIVEMKRGGKSNRKIMEKLDMSIGGDSNGKIRTVLEKYKKR